MITSLQNERVKRSVRLRKGRYRRKEGLFVIDGARELSRAVAAGIEIIELFVTARPGEQDAETVQALQQGGEAAGEVLEVTPAIMRKLCFGDRDEGFVAIARIPNRSLSDLDPPADGLVAIIEDVEKPGNIGGVLRTADGAGLHGMIAIGGGTDLFNPNIIRASLGTVFSLPVCTAEPDVLLPWLSERRFQIVTTLVDAEHVYTDVDYCQPTAIVLGSEADGLSSHWREDARQGDTQQGDIQPEDAPVSTPQFQPVRIPMLGAADSLNVSASAAVLFYEARRQRDAMGGNDSGRAAPGQRQDVASSAASGV